MYKENMQLPVNVLSYSTVKKQGYFPTELNRIDCDTHQVV